MTLRTRVAIFLAAVVLGASGVAGAQPVRDLYTQALARDRTVRDARQSPTRQQIRSAIAQYERVVRRYPKSGYSDNALWQASELARLAWMKPSRHSRRLDRRRRPSRKPRRRLESQHQTHLHHAQRPRQIVVLLPSGWFAASLALPCPTA
jgi:hypothetical protein